MAKSDRVAINRVRARLRQAAEESGLTQEDIGLRMGYAKGGARQAVSRLLHPESDHDPRLSTLLDFARALGRPLNDIL